MADIRVYPDAQTVARAAAEAIAARAEIAVTTRGHFTIALSGGSTPRAVYELLASEEFLPRIDWTATYVFWGDERCVPPEHADSNYRMARLALLDYEPIPLDHLYRMPGEAPPDEAAAAYEDSLGSFFAERGEQGKPQPRFDLVLLGLGDDAHTASLFPGTSALEEGEHWVVAQHVGKLDAWRLTLTPVAINAAESIVFLVSGASKAQAVAAVLEGPRAPLQHPAQLIQPVQGHLTWMLDEAAASALVRAD